MQPTRRAWAAASLAVLLAVAAIGFDQPALLVGTAALGAWLVGSAYGFLRTVTAVDDGIDLEVTVAPATALVDDAVEITLRGSEIETTAQTLGFLRLPSSLASDATAADRTIRLVEAVPTETTITTAAPVAGEFTVPAPEVTVVDDSGLFRESFVRGPTRSLSVVPRHPGDLSVSEGDRAVSALEGGETSERRNRGTEPAEIRKYIPGETADRIDWNATARLTETYVREFEVESATEANFIIDDRASLQTGPSGKTPFDYLREVALGLLAISRSVGDPVGLAVVDDDGIATLQQPTNRPGGYAQLRRRIRSLDPESATRRPRGQASGNASLAVRLASVDDAGSPYLATLSGYFDERTPLPPENSPFRSAIRGFGAGSDARTVIFTDDTDRREIREAVEEARQGPGQVILFLAPTVLYERDAMTDIPTAYERYSDFETFREDISALEGVTAFEVNPGNRSQRLRSDEVEGPA